MPKSLTHMRSATNWKPASDVSNCTSSAIVSAPVATDTSSAVARTNSWRDRGTSATSEPSTIR